jgi:hypothetical protein
MIDPTIELYGERRALDVIASIEVLLRNAGRPLSHDELAWHFPDERISDAVWFGVALGRLMMADDWHVAAPPDPDYCEACGEVHEEGHRPRRVPYERRKKPAPPPPGSAALPDSTSPIPPTPSEGR